MPVEIDLPCPCGRTPLGRFAGRASGQGQTEADAKEDAVQNAVGDIMMQVPWVDCTGKCQPVFTVDIRAPSAVTASKVAENDFKAAAHLRAEVSVECTDREVAPGGHVVLIRNGVLPPRPDSNLTDDGSIVIGKNICPPKEKTCWRLVDSGVHTGPAATACVAALAAYQASYPQAQKAAEQDAKNFIATAKCDGDCVPNGTLLLGPFATTQEWEINIHVEPNTAQTWAWVGHLGVVFCKKSG